MSEVQITITNPVDFFLVSTGISVIIVAIAFGVTMCIREYGKHFGPYTEEDE